VSEKETGIFLEHILENIKKIEKFSIGMAKEDLEKNELKQYAIVRAIEIIGEAARNLPLKFRERHSEIPWKNIIGTRDIMIHRYFGIDTDIVWNIIKEDLPKFKRQIEEIANNQ